jgi:hypothetical protein
MGGHEVRTVQSAFNGVVGDRSQLVTPSFHYLPGASLRRPVFWSGHGLTLRQTHIVEKKDHRYFIVRADVGTRRHGVLTAPRRVKVGQINVKWMQYSHKCSPAGRLDGASISTSNQPKETDVFIGTRGRGFAGLASDNMTVVHRS